MAPGGEAGTVRPLVSVALATYNGARFLRQQLDSIYAQTVTALEVVVCDDCSSDGTVAILEEYRRSRGLSYQVNDRNLGFVRNFARVLSHCTGEYVALADQDDLWLPDKLERLMAGIGTASLVYSDATLIDGDGRELPGTLVRGSGVLPVTGAPFPYFVCNSCVTGCTVLLRRELLAIALPVPEWETYHDWWLAVAATRARGVAYLDERLTCYRQHGANDTGANIKRPLLQRIADRYGAGARTRKAGYFRLLQERAHRYPELTDRLELTGSELAFLADLGRYAGARLAGNRRLTAFRLAWRYRATLFPGATPAELAAYLLATLIV